MSFRGFSLCVEKVAKNLERRRRRKSCLLGGSTVRRDQQQHQKKLAKATNAEAAKEESSICVVCVFEPRESSPRKKQAKGEGPAKAN